MTFLVGYMNLSTLFFQQKFSILQETLHQPLVQPSSSGRGINYKIIIRGSSINQIHMNKVENLIKSNDIKRAMNELNWIEWKVVIISRESELLDLAVAILPEEKANMRKVVDNPVKPLSAEEEVLTHLLGVHSVNHYASPFFKLPHIPYCITVLAINLLCK